MCDPIEGTSTNIMAEKLGLDAKKYVVGGGARGEDDDLIDFTPKSNLPDSERYKDCERLRVCCGSCGVASEFNGVFRLGTDEKSKFSNVMGGLKCPNPGCVSPEWWGEGTSLACFGRISNALNLAVKGRVKEYYDGCLRCDDLTCGLETKQLSVCGGVCLARGCNGKLLPKYSEADLHLQLKYYDSLFDVDRAVKGYIDAVEVKIKGMPKDAIVRSLDKGQLERLLNRDEKCVMEELRSFSANHIGSSAYNWVSSSLFNIFATTQ